jgi:hypothetical protein
VGRRFLDVWVEEMDSGCNPNWPDQVIPTHTPSCFINHHLTVLVSFL